MKNKEKIEIMKYKRNSLSYSLILIGLIFNIIYFIKLYQENDLYFYNISMGISVIYNLMFMLFVFLSAEKLKATGYVVVRIISQESLIDSNELMENKFPDNYQVYLYTMDNTINFIF